MPELSVLLPVKDGQATIGAAVRSTLRAMPRDSELLVVDDGSRDDTASVLAAVADGRLRVLRHETSQGVAASLNEALAQSDSNVVARMDGDDLSLPWRFRAQLPALARADLVFGSMILIDDRSRPVGLSNPAPVSPATAALYLLLENPFSHPTLVARRQAIIDAGGYRATPVEDYDLWLRIAATSGALRKLSVPVLAYRRHGGQATQGWRPGGADPLLDASYAALLPEHLHDSATRLREAALFRQPQLAGADRVALVDHLRSAADALAPGDRRRLLRRLRAKG